MILAVVIKPNHHPELVQLNGYEDFKNALDGGYLEAVGLAENVVCYVDEDGIAKELPFNPVATAVVRMALAKLERDLIPGDYIKGTAIFAGFDFDAGNKINIPHPFLKEFFPELVSQDE